MIAYHLQAILDVEPLTSCAAIDNYCILICLCFASDALMNSITSYLFDGAPESKNTLGTTRATDAMNIISPCSAFNSFSLKACSLWRTVALTKALTWTFTRKAPSLHLPPSPSCPLFFLRSRRDLWGFKYCWQRQGKGRNWYSEREGEELEKEERQQKEGRRRRREAVPKTRWMKSKLHTKLFWLALWN